MERTQSPARARREIGPTGLVLWHLPDSVFEIMWLGPYTRLMFGVLSRPGGMHTAIDHPSADGAYATLRDAQAAVDRFVAACATDGGAS